MPFHSDHGSWDAWDVMGHVPPRPNVVCVDLNHITTLRLGGTCTKRPRRPMRSTFRAMSTSPSTRTSGRASVVCGAGQRPPRRHTRVFRPDIHRVGHETSCPVRSARFSNESRRSEGLRANRWDLAPWISARVENPAVLLHPVASGGERGARNLRPLASVGTARKFSKTQKGEALWAAQVA